MQIPALHTTLRACAALLLMTAAASALAEPAAITREERTSAWKAQAVGVAKSIILDEAATTTLVDAYVAARGPVQDLVDRVEGQGEDIHKHLKEYRALTRAERDKLEQAITPALDEAQRTAALKSLGTFSRQWDRAIHTLSAFTLEGDKQDKAFAAVTTYAEEIDTARSEAMMEGDSKGMMAKFGVAREKLDAAMAELLGSEDLARFQEATKMGSGRPDKKDDKDEEAEDAGSEEAKPYEEPADDSPQQ
jgi:hypothetical protein